ncbi:MAG TPA: hypothetical protein VFX97_14225 [Pyrinomonadaceae bacterium]|nr:hypothetical protein [Pyrinomonadaceae bacterium]
MNDPALRIPVVFPAKIHLVSHVWARYSWRQVNVVGNEQGLPRAEFQDKTLMPASLVVVRKNLLDHAPAFDLKLASLTLEGASKYLVVLGRETLLYSRRAAENTYREKEDES